MTKLGGIAGPRQKFHSMVMKQSYFQIRDPIHGVISISQDERAIIDSRVFQRLRNIKQVGFADFAFPCATHSRYSHSLGAMMMASRIFDRVIAKDMIAQPDWLRLRQAVRLAALLHDVGHPPLSHTTERLMPKVCELNPQITPDDSRRATHEDFTERLIVASPLTRCIEDHFRDLGLSPQLIASLLKDGCDIESFTIAGVDFSPILRQIISSEIDADRMDYLLRDSFFCGVNYGKFDSEWLIDNLIAVEKHRQVFLGLRARAIFAFEDFLLSRYHMFASVYLHHTPVIMEKMLERFFVDCPTALILSADIEKYIELDDIDLWQTLKKSRNQWARRIVDRQPYVMLYESVHGNADVFEEMVTMLQKARLDVITSQSRSILSTYCGKIKHPVFVESAEKKAVPLEEFSPLFARYQRPAELTRIFVDHQEKDKAKKIISDFFER